MTITESTLTASSAAGAYTGLKPSGWNATMTTLTKVKATATGTVITKPSSYQPAFKAEVEAAFIGSEANKPSPYLPALKVEAEEKAASFSGTAYALTTSSGNKTHVVRARQAPDLVFATIDGELDSWVNNWNGPPSSTPVTEPSVAPIVRSPPTVNSATLSPLKTAVPIPVISIATSVHAAGKPQ